MKTVETPRMEPMMGPTTQDLLSGSEEAIGEAVGVLVLVLLVVRAAWAVRLACSAAPMVC